MKTYVKPKNKRKMENEKTNHLPPFYATTPDQWTLIIDRDNREFPFSELIKEQSESKVVLKICDVDNAKFRLSIAFGYGFLYRKGQEGNAVLLDLLDVESTLLLDSGEYGVTEKESGE